jgi:hypothetical protein
VLKAKKITNGLRKWQLSPIQGKVHANLPKLIQSACLGSRGVINMHIMPMGVAIHANCFIKVLYIFTERLKKKRS